MGRRPNGALPRVRVVRPSMNARVRIGGRAYWLGPCPDGKVTAEQTAKATRLWQEFLATGAAELQPPDARPPAVSLTASVAAPPPPPAQTAGTLTIAQLSLKYLDDCQSKYRKPDGTPTSTVDGARMALKALFPFADVPVSAFGPKSLKLVRESLVRDGRPRCTCNRIIKTIRRVFAWGVSEELVPVDVWHSLKSVSALQKGRTEAPEVAPVEEVAEAVVSETLRHTCPVISAMIQLQRWTGARPGEVCLVRPCDVDRSGEVWIYTPEYHKLSWRESTMPRRIAIGAEGQRILAPYLLRSPSDYCFSPRESEAARSRHRRLARKTALTPSQRARRPKRDGQRRPREKYDTAFFRRAITRAVDAANRARRGAGVEDELPSWSPNQLRHLRAGEVEVAVGIEAANAVLGHTNIRTTEIYARRKLVIATEVARRMG